MAGKRLSVVNLDDPGQRRLVVLLAQIPTLGPGKLGIANALAGVGHAFDSEICTIRENGGEHGMGLVVLLARADIPKCREEAGALSNLEKELGYPDARE